jgi:hypothetical protein
VPKKVIDIIQSDVFLVGAAIQAQLDPNTYPLKNLFKAIDEKENTLKWKEQSSQDNAPKTENGPSQKHQVVEAYLDAVLEGRAKDAKLVISDVKKEMAKILKASGELTDKDKIDKYAGQIAREYAKAKGEKLDVVDQAKYIGFKIAKHVNKLAKTNSRQKVDEVMKKVNVHTKKNLGTRTI